MAIYVSGRLVSLSVIVPAFNEQAYIGKTLDHINRSIADVGLDVQVIVVDNGSTDQTADVARASGASVFVEPTRNVARARNTGARASNGETLLFIDADTLVPVGLLSRINEVMSAPACVGGAVDIRYQPASLLIRGYLGMWRLLGNALGMAQGAAQFCRRDVYLALRGYDETLFMGEDLDFYWRLRRLAKRTRQTVCPIFDLQVVPSCRRFDAWPIWKTVVWTNPLFILLLQRRQKAWTGWYQDPPR
jgi:glycosyltransferase involved in cell wall biosynthesis